MNYPGQQAPLQGMANEMAQYGRYGDSMLVHMNPAEVQGIAALSPTGQLTTNPVTGQPEAFLPFLAPILGTALGKAFLPALASKIGIAGLGGNVAGAIGSGLATTAVTGDLKEGILSGITGYGLGQMIGGAADALDPSIAQNTEALAETTKDLATAGSDAAKANAAMASALGEVGSATNPFGTAMTADSAAKAIADASAASAKEAQLLGARDLLSGKIDAARSAITPMQTLTAPFREPGAFLKSAARPEAILPIAIGEGTRGQYQMQERLQDQRRELMGKSEEEKARALYNFQEALSRREQDYGPFRRYAAGGITSINPDNYRQNMEGLQRLAGMPVQMQAGGTTGAGARQASIRPPTVVAPPEGYRPGFDPEFMYFQDAPPPPPTSGGDAPAPSPGTGTGGTGGAPATGGSTLTPEIIDRYTRLATTEGNFHRQSDLSGRNIQNRETHLSDFMTMRAQYPELIALDNTLDIDPAYRQGGSEAWSDVGGNTFGEVEGAGQSATGATAAGTTRSAGPNVQQMGMDFYNEVIELNPGISPAEVGQMTAQRYPGFVPPSGAAAGTPAMGGQIRPGSMTSGPDPEARGLPAQERMGSSSGRAGRAPMEVNAIPALAADLGVQPGGIADLGAPAPAPAPAPASAGPAGIVAGGPPPVMDTPADVMGDSMQPSVTPAPPPPPVAFRGRGFDFGSNEPAPTAPPSMTPPPSGGIADRAPAPAPSPAASRVESNEEIMERLADLRRRGAFSNLASGVGRIGMQEGGQTEVEIDIEMDDTMEANGARLIEQTAAAIAGNMPEDQAETIINRFIDEYGSEAFEMLRERVLQDIVPDAQTEGRIRGQGGGMDDMIPGMIGTQQPVAVSPGEYIVPADVVSGLGDGDTDAGASELDGMLDRVRQARTGRRMQPQPLQKDKVMPA